MEGNARWAVVRNLPYLVHLKAAPLPASDAKKICKNIVQVIKINRKLISSQIGLERNGAILEIRVLFNFLGCVIFHFCYNNCSCRSELITHHCLLFQYSTKDFSCNCFKTTKSFWGGVKIQIQVKSIPLKYGHWFKRNSRNIGSKEKLNLRETVTTNLMSYLQQ